MDERDLLPASIQSGAKFNVYLQFSRIEDRVALLKDSGELLSSASMQCLLHKYKSKV